MSKNFVRIFSLLSLVAILGFSACENNSLDDLSSELVENFTDEAIYNLEMSGNIGNEGCYELVFPITIIFADSTTADVEDYDDLRETISAWKESNSDIEGRPSFVFPLELISEDGEIITAANREELREARAACRRNYFSRKGHKGHRNRCNQCFDIVYPLPIAFPGGTTAEAADRMELKQLVRDWKEANPDATERPEIVYPITVVLQDSTQLSVASVDELKALKESCATEN